MPDYSEESFRIKQLEIKYNGMDEYFERAIKILEERINTLESKLSDVDDIARNANRWAHSH